MFQCSVPKLNQSKADLVCQDKRHGAQAFAVRQLRSPNGQLYVREGFAFPAGDANRAQRAQRAHDQTVVCDDLVWEHVDVTKVTYSRPRPFVSGCKARAFALTALATDAKGYITSPNKTQDVYVRNRLDYADGAAVCNITKERNAWWFRNDFLPEKVIDGRRKNQWCSFALV